MPAGGAEPFAVPSGADDMPFDPFEGARGQHHSSGTITGRSRNAMPPTAGP